MSFTIEIPDALAERLRTRAAVSGEDITTFTAAWLSDTLATDETEAVAGIREGLADSDAGSETPLSESFAGMLEFLDNRGSRNERDIRTPSPAMKKAA